MSTKTEHRPRLKKMYKDDETPLKPSKSMTSNKSRKLKSVSPSIIGFNSETFSSSSSLKLDINSEKRSRKKKVRSTQDFNYLSSSFTSQDSEKSTKSKAKKTKKSNKVYNLPRISQVVEDFSSNPHVFSEEELTQKKRIKTKSKKRFNSEPLEDANYENRRKKVHKIKQDKVEVLSSFNKLQPKENTEEYLSANSIISDSQKDSDEEFVIKDKRKLTKKKRKGRSVNDHTEEEDTERYAKRLKKLLSDTLIRSSKSNNSSCLSTPLPEQKSEENEKNTKEIKRDGTPKVIRPSVYGDNQASTRKQSISTRLSHRINSTPYPKMKLLNSPYVDFKEKEKQSMIIRHSRTNSSEKGVPEAQSVKIKNKRSSTGNSILSVNVSFEMDFDSDDVFNDTFQNNTGTNQECLQSNTFYNNDSVKSRKSVRFQSPEQNIRRETIILSKPIVDDITIKPDKPTYDDVTHIQSGNTKKNSTFEITSPNIINQSVHQNQPSFCNSLNKQNTLYKRKISTSGPSKSRDRKSSTQLLSPINKSLRKSGNEKSTDTASNSIIDLTTPMPLKKIDPSVTLGSEKLNDNDISVQLNRSSTFSKDDKESKSTPVHTVSAHLDNNTTLVPNLVRTATFIKDNESDMKYSPLPSDNSYSKIVDTSKVNKRKRWDKSRLSVSLLDNSLNIGNISAPWTEYDSIKILNDSNTDIHKQSVDAKCSKITDSRPNKVSFKNCPTPPSGTSTPYVKGKISLLRQALLKSKPDVTVNESKNHTVQVQKPLTKVVRTKIPNFALIHQRAYDRLENIKEMSERKAIRAKLLLSGRKPPSENGPKTSTKRKELKFSPGQSKTSSFNEIKKVNKSLNNSNISVAKINKISPSTSNLKVANKENRLTPIEKKKELLKAKSLIPKPKLHGAVISEKKNFTRFGFKIGSEGVKKTTKDEQVKAVTTKSKIMKNTLEERRNVIQGVRSNRRFELLMNMRMK